MKSTVQLFLPSPSAPHHRAPLAVIYPGVVAQCGPTYRSSASARACTGFSTPSFRAQCSQTDSAPRTAAPPHALGNSGQLCSGLVRPYLRNIGPRASVRGRHRRPSSDLAWSPPLHFPSSSFTYDRYRSPDLFRTVSGHFGPTHRLAKHRSDRSESPADAQTSRTI